MNSPGLMASKAVELGRMVFLDRVFLAGAVAFHTRLVVVDSYIFMSGVGRNARKTLSRYGKKQSDNQQHKNNKPNRAFHAVIISYIGCQVLSLTRPDIFRNLFINVRFHFEKRAGI